MTSRIKFYHLKAFSYAVFFLGIFFGGRFAVNGIAFFILIALIGLFLEGTVPFRKFNKLLLLPFLFYLLHFASVFHSQHRPEAFFDMEVKLSFFILPLLFGFEKEDKRLKINTILLLFSASSLVAALFLLLRAVYLYSVSGTFPVYISFSPFVHVSYISAYFTFNIVAGAFLLKKHMRKALRFMLYASVFFSFLAIIPAESKTAFLLLLLIIVLYVFNHLPTGDKLTAGLAALVVLLGFALLLVNTVRFKALIYSINNYTDIVNGKKLYVESSGERIMSWSAAALLIKENFWTGTGNGDVRIELTGKYKELGYDEAAKLRLNAHNQYLETFLAMGFPGFVFLLVMLFAPLFFSHGDLSLLLRFFILIFSFNFLFESMLNTQAGVIFFVFFYSFLIAKNHEHYKNI